MPAAFLIRNYNLFLFDEVVFAVGADTAASCQEGRKGDKMNG